MLMISSLHPPFKGEMTEGLWCGPEVFVSYEAGVGVVLDVVALDVVLQVE